MFLRLAVGDVGARLGESKVQSLRGIRDRSVLVQKLAPVRRGESLGLRDDNLELPIELSPVVLEEGSVIWQRDDWLDGLLAALRSYVLHRLLILRNKLVLLTHPQNTLYGQFLRQRPDAFEESRDHWQRERVFPVRLPRPLWEVVRLEERLRFALDILENGRDAVDDDYGIGG